MLLLVSVVAGVAWFISQPQPQAEPSVKETQKPVEVLTEADEWYANLDKLTVMPYPDFVCETFINTEVSIPIGNGETVTSPVDTYVDKGAYRFITAPDIPTNEELFPVITPNVEFERCSVNIPVIYNEVDNGDDVVLEPDLSSVDSVIAKYGQGDNGESVSWNPYDNNENMADAVSKEIFLTNVLSVENEVTVEGNSTTVTVNEIISIAFQDEESLGNPPEEALNELRSRITEEQYAILNSNVEKILN